MFAVRPLAAGERAIVPFQNVFIAEPYEPDKALQAAVYRSSYCAILAAAPAVLACYSHFEGNPWIPDIQFSRYGRGQKKPPYFIWGQVRGFFKFF